MIGSGANDKITIRANGAALSSLNFFDSWHVPVGISVIDYNGQQITVTNHFVLAGTKNIEKLAFSGGASYAGYGLGSAELHAQHRNGGVRCEHDPLRR